MSDKAFRKVVLPILRRTVPVVIANEIVASWEATKNFPFAMKLCEDCGGSGNHFHMKDGKPTWDKCKPCDGRGVR